ncbi:YdcF family protein [Scatolibacter rhodanostii]|uniref:YdcF family protein n=1 Tax=Scatolibacter rhodanostii TaxID=2014781 RepID=UPI000C084D3F|nr:YdcF family protein [Scatolibacter rhodanostii]
MELQKKKVGSILRVIAGGILSAIMIWFMIPLLTTGFLGSGTVFGVFVCVLGIVLLWVYPPINKIGGWKTVLIRLLAFFFVSGMLWAGYLTFLMLSAANRKPPENTNVIILGARIYEDGKMSLSLKQRVDRAYQYLEENAEANCITTGGQGDNEPFAEALAEKKALIKMGVDETRIFMEDQSHNTRQNMDLSAEIARENELGNEIAVVTQGFHMYRSLKLAESAGFTAYSLPSKTDPRMLPTYYGRELLSLTKWKLEELFLGGTSK